MKKKIISGLLFVFLFQTLAISQHVITDANISFKIKNLGFNVDGSFSKSKIESDFYSETVANWKLEGNVQVKSISTDNETRDEHLLESDYFDEANFPEMTLVANSFKKTSQDLYQVDVVLTIKGTSKTYTVPMQIVKEASKEVLSCDFEINRRDFDVGGGSLMLSNTVKIHVAYNIRTN